MSKYFTIQHGLRGCFMPDASAVYQVDTRRQLKAIIASEAESYRDDGYVGASKAAIATLAADAWREAGKARPSVYPVVMGLAAPHAPRDYVYGIHVSTATRAEYLASLESE